MSSDCAFSKSNPFEQYQAKASSPDPEDLTYSIYTVSITVSDGPFYDSVTMSFTSLLQKPAGTFSGILIPSSLTAGTYSGNAAFIGTVSSYVGQQIIALATQAAGLNTINFVTPSAVIGSVTSTELDVSCSAGLFQAKAAS